jgi:hypothetical protein
MPRQAAMQTIQEPNMDKRIKEIEVDEGEFFVWLTKGYCLDLGTSKDFQHCFGVKNKQELDEEMKKVRKCNCPDCV